MPESGKYNAFLHIDAKKNDGSWESVNKFKLSDPVIVEGNVSIVKMDNCECKFFINPAKFSISADIENFSSHDTGSLLIFLYFAKKTGFLMFDDESVSNNNTMCCFEIAPIKAKTKIKISTEVKFTRSMPANNYKAKLHIQEQNSDGSYKYLATHDTGITINWPGN